MEGETEKGTQGPRQTEKFGTIPKVTRTDFVCNEEVAVSKNRKYRMTNKFKGTVNIRRLYFFKI